MPKGFDPSECPRQGIKTWRYDIQPPNNFPWSYAIIVIDETGYFSTVSDYGNYAFRWTHPGKEFRYFLAYMSGGDYLISKLGYAHPQIYKVDKTLENIREYIIQARKDGTFDKEQAREEWQLLHDLNGLESEGDLHDWYSHTEISDAWEFARYGHSSDLECFAKHVFPHFQQLLRKELEKEAACSTSSTG